jgi:hypothetical protein
LEGLEAAEVKEGKDANETERPFEVSVSINRNGTVSIATKVPGLPGGGTARVTRNGEGKVTGEYATGEGEERSEGSERGEEKGDESVGKQINNAIAKANPANQKTPANNVKAATAKASAQNRMSQIKVNFSMKVQGSLRAALNNSRGSSGTQNNKSSGGNDKTAKPEFGAKNNVKM